MEDEILWLKRTIDMLKRAFEHGLPDPLYRPLLFFLYEHMSNRCLAKSISHAFNMDYEMVLHDVYDVAFKRDISEEDQRTVSRMLSGAGLADWLNEG